MIRQLTVGLIFAVALSTFARVSRAAVLGFDDIPASAAVPNGYGGFTWNSVFVHDRTIPASGYFKGVVSGTQTAYNVSENVATVMSSLFNFNSAYLTGAWNNGLNVKVDGYLGPTQIYTKTATVNVSGPTLVNFNFVGIDRLVFTSSGGTPDPAAATSGSGTHFVMDDFSYTIPEPGSLSLACLAAGWLPLRRRPRCPRHSQPIAA